MWKKQRSGATALLRHVRLYKGYLQGSQCKMTDSKDFCEKKAFPQYTRGQREGDMHITVSKLQMCLCVHIKLLKGFSFFLFLVLETVAPRFTRATNLEGLLSPLLGCCNKCE